jgi:hypothetical protein
VCRLRYDHEGVLVLKAGDAVELRSPAEILATLDENGCLEGLPFMPEMLGFFGRPFEVTAQVARACDTFHYAGTRRLRDTVTLDDLRCDGSGHVGCGTQCRLYWKEAWLRPATSGARTEVHTSDDALAKLERLATEGTRGHDSTPEVPTYRCQATELLRASDPVPWWSLSSFLHEVTSGNVGVWRFVRVLTRIGYEGVLRRLGRWTNAPFKPEEMTGRGAVLPPPRGLQPGQLVQIRSGAEVSRTLNEQSRTKGLWFDREMKVYCGQTARVKARVERFIDEPTGRLVTLSTDAYILEDVVCNGFLSNGRWFCPRAIYPWWREAWLEPLEAADDATSSDTVTNR